MKIGIIGGTGWLGGAIARALLDTGFVVQGDLWLSNTSGRRDGFEDRLAGRSEPVSLCTPYRPGGRRPDRWVQ